MSGRQLPPLPRRCAGLPRDKRSFPVPRFVAWVVPPGGGDREPDFRVSDTRFMAEAVRRKLCWICGQPLGVRFAFVIGPMCSVTRSTSEPPSHQDCAEFAARACPFLSNPDARRRERAMPAHGGMPGIPLARNPGVCAVWSTRSYRLFGDQRRRAMIQVGEPFAVSWWHRGRPATRDEVWAAIQRGLPALQGVADAEGLDASLDLDRMIGAALLLMPPVSGETADAA